jgi:hypothetical protein
MKKSQLRQIIKEEISRVLNEQAILDGERASENLNISDVISRLSSLNRYNFIVNWDDDNMTLNSKKDENGDWVKGKDIQKILNDI